MIQRYENGCMMLMKRSQDSVLFLGTAFIVHSEGYLLTAAHYLKPDDELVLVSPAQAGGYTPLSMEVVTPYPVRLIDMDRARNLALLKLDFEEPVAAPQDIIGNADETNEGTYVLSFGVSFGHLRIHNIMVMQGIVSAKMLSPNETRLFLFDAVTHPGTIGGPLVNSNDGRIIGIIQGRFDPVQISQQQVPEELNIASHLSYAVSIQHGRELAERHGVTI
ncbi:MAG: serine protease [Verrucomicrobiota bacterium JB022]|nr:serine protease [Verrucomicrobiota bacterium JB022]